MSEEISEKKLKGTTTVGVVFKGGVVLAADKRATLGYFIAAKEVEKIHVVADKIAVTMAGGVGDAQSLVRLIRAELELYKYQKGGALSIEGAATLLSNILQGSKYFPYLVQLVVAGYDVQPRLFDVDAFGGLIEEKYVATGSGSPIAYGVLDEGFKEGMQQNDAVKLAARSIYTAIKRDAPTGDGIDLLCITGREVKRYSKEEINSLTQTS